MNYSDTLIQTNFVRITRTKNSPGLKCVRIARKNVLVILLFEDILVVVLCFILSSSVQIKRLFKHVK